MGIVTHANVPLLDSSTIRYNTKQDVKEAIGENITARSTQANSSPIYQGAQFKLLGYCADIEMAIEILDKDLLHLKAQMGLCYCYLMEIAQI